MLIMHRLDFIRFYKIADNQAPVRSPSSTYRLNIQQIFCDIQEAANSSLHTARMFALLSSSGKYCGCGWWKYFCWAKTRPPLDGCGESGTWIICNVSSIGFQHYDSQELRDCGCWWGFLGRITWLDYEHILFPSCFISVLLERSHC